jgi:hypothetical protein
MVAASAEGIPAGRDVMALGAFPLERGVFAAIFARNILKASFLGKFAEVGDFLFPRPLGRNAPAF